MYGDLAPNPESLVGKYFQFSDAKFANPEDRMEVVTEVTLSIWRLYTGIADYVTH